MTKQVPWNKIILEEFIGLAMLSKDEEIIMRTRIAGWSVSQQADAYNNVSMTNNIIQTLQPTPRPAYVVSSPYATNALCNCGYGTTYGTTV